jgi:tRNA-2-methylthio-N6-dimethylallyladenosine synthase
MMIDLPVLDIEKAPEAAPKPHELNGRKLYVETYGCQMNINDSEIVLSIMSGSGYEITDKPDNADVILLNTCAIRDNAEKKIHERLMHLRYYKKRNKNLVVGVLGCMAERLRSNLVGEQNLVNIVVGPDEFRKVPDLVENAIGGSSGIAVKLSRVETYDDIVPLRTEGMSAWVSIMRGCDKFCTYCVVPFTRGRERSRSFESIVAEVRGLWDDGFKEVTLLGQNVNSYFDEPTQKDFADLLAACAEAVPQMRIRYTTSHPQDMSDKLIETMAAFKNICKYIHLPFQAGNDRVLELMNRTYTIEHYYERIAKIKELMPNCALSTDVIVGFPTETEEEFADTLEVMRRVRYEGAYLFKYSPRENTKAWKMGDDVPEDVKGRRLEELIKMQREITAEVNQEDIGKIHEILVEGPSKKNQAEWQGRTDTNKMVIFPHNEHSGYIVGDLINVKILSANAAVLRGELV